MAPRSLKQIHVPKMAGVLGPTALRPVFNLLQIFRTQGDHHLLGRASYRYGTFRDDHKNGVAIVPFWGDYKPAKKPQPCFVLGADDFDGAVVHLQEIHGQLDIGIWDSLHFSSWVTKNDESSLRGCVKSEFPEIGCSYPFSSRQWGKLGHLQCEQEDIP